MNLEKLLWKYLESGKKIQLVIDDSGWNIEVFEDEHSMIEEQGQTMAKLKQVLMDHVPE